MIKVVQLQYSTASGGSSALRLQKAFLKAGIGSSIISLQADRVRDDKIRYLGFRSKLIGRIDAKLQSFLTLPKLKDSGSFSFPILGSDVAWMEQVKDADYIYLHWILNGFLSLKSIEKLAKLNKPIIIFMHDMWPITGGCHYSLTCEKYTVGCDECPMFITETKNDFSKKEFKNKLRFYSKYDNLFFVSPSTWLYDCAKQALLTKDKPVFYIPNILDNTIFKSLDKKRAKEILNIDTEETVIAFGAVSIDSSRKGWAYLQKALEILHEKKEFQKVLVLIFGSGNNSKMAAAIPFKVKFMGYLKDEYSKVLVYNAADVFIVPSLADNQPTTVQESLSCGTPVVGFKIGGIPDMIRHKENGYLAAYQDSEDIAEGIKYCCKENLKGYMLPSFQPAATIQKHLDLFEYTKTQKKK
jgi:glycosyltransferase involved in cell wall biosynthesis